MKLSIQRTTLGAALCALSVVGVQSQVTIDAFTDPGTPTSVSANQAAPTPAPIDVSGLTGVVGGRRIVSSTWTGGTAAAGVSAVVDPAATGGAAFAANSDTDQDGFAEITWPIAGGADLTVGGAVAFEYTTVANDNGAVVTFTVTDGTPTVGTQSFPLAALASGLTIVPFDGFSPSLDFTDITEVKIKIDTVVASDVSMRTILTTRPQDFGDAPVTYCTLEADNGPRHFIAFDTSGDASGPTLGVAGNIDPDEDGNPSANAMGDNIIELPSSPFDDETGMTMNLLRAADSASNYDLVISGVTGGNPNVNAWIDFNADGDFADAGEQILTNDTSNGNGTHNYSFTPPATAAVGNSYMRVRISTAALPTTDGFKGSADDGEVEDYLVALTAFDWGDALDDGTVIGTITTAFNTTAGANNGANHEIVANAAILGSAIDPEGDGNPTAGADGDDTVGSPDDEDGVSGLPSVITTTGGSFPLTITVGGGTNGDVYAWADISSGIAALGGDGDFDNFGDQFLGTFGAAYNGGGGLTLNNVTGAQNFTLVIPPTGLVAGNPIFVRFRVANTGTAVAGPTGSVINGEVEDYVIQVVAQLQDWGDAPDSYDTTSGPNHNISGPTLGSNIDAETAGIPSGGADGDDTAQSPDDEDGVDFASVGTINPGDTISLPITTTGGTGRFLNGWIDFNGDGDFGDALEHVLDNVSVGAGTVNQNISIPVSSATGTTYARFRLTETASAIAAATRHTGNETTGEVEDYAITITPNLDFGDAPETGTSGNGVGTNNYGTTLANNGPRHSITGPGLGGTIDAETDGQPNSAATGDGADEDGVTFPDCLSAGIANNIPIQVNGTGKLSLWIDLNGDGDFLDSGEMLLNNVPHTGTLPFPINIPTTATPGATYARARVIALGDPDLTSPLGAASSGEVEDYAVSICKDFGDAPDTYCTVLASDGPRHDNTGPRLGPLRDAETNASAVTFGAVADGDDNAGSDDEDGVTFSNSGVFDTTSSSNQITFTLSSTADVEVYVDWNRDGDFDDAGEKYDFDNHAGGTESLSVGTLSTDGVTYVRVRAYTIGQALDSPKGNATSGEVEDYRITLSTPTLVDLLSFDATATETGQVAINWSTGAEIDTAGFNLTRRQLTDDSAASYEAVKLNSQLIPSRGTSAEGASYDYMDTPGYGTFNYQLEDIETSGRVGLHGFREVTILPTLEIGVGEDSKVNVNYLVLPGWDYEVEYKSLADEDSDWQALPNAPHNEGVVSDELGTETTARLYRLKASLRE